MTTAPEFFAAGINSDAARSTEHMMSTTRSRHDVSVPAARPGRLGRSLAFVVIAALALLAPIAPAGAQYGQLSGLFVITSPDDPNTADFTGLGCAGGSEVVLYMPGIAPTSSDPTAGQSVPGRILAVTTATASADPLLDGTFVFDDVRLPTDLQPGLYEVHARCGPVDLVVLVRLGINGVVVVQPDDADPDDILNPTGSLPLTGRSAQPMVTAGVLLVGVGALVVLGSRRRQDDPAAEPTHG